MQAGRTTWTDQQVENAIGWLLRIGLVIAALVVLAGGAVFVTRHHAEPADFRVFRGEPADLRTIGGTVEAARRGEGRGIIQLGLMILLATPVARVAFSVVAYALEGDRLYVGITLIVLVLLIASISGWI